MLKRNNLTLNSKIFYFLNKPVEITSDLKFNFLDMEVTFSESVDHLVIKKKDEYRISKEIIRACFNKNIKTDISRWNELRILTCSDGETIIKFPEKGINETCLNGFRTIPGFTRYHINELGKVYNKKTDFYSTPYLGNAGYLMFGLTPDVGNRTIIGLHRLLCLAFLDYDENVDDFVTNHKDGNKTNNLVTNLELVSYSENIQHAYSNGLRNDNCFVEVRDIKSGSIVEFTSISSTAKAFDVSSKLLDFRLANSQRKVYFPHHQFKKKNDEKWEEISKMEIAKQKPKLLIYNKLTKAEITVDGYETASKIVSIKPATIFYRLKNNGKSEDDNFIITRLFI